VQGGSKGDLQMISGADTMLDMIAGDPTNVILQMYKRPFKDSDELVLTEEYDLILGSVIILYKLLKNKYMNRKCAFQM
jgi:hypothetical protein